MANLNVDYIKRLHTLTRTELDLVFYLLPLAATHNVVYGVSYKDVCEATGMCPQSFYTSMKSLTDKNILRARSSKIVVKDGEVIWKFDTSPTGIYDIMLDNYNEDDKVSYINLNRKFFTDERWTKLTSNAKWLLLMFLSYTSAHENAIHKKNIQDFYCEMQKLLKKTERQVRKYLREIKTFFTIIRINKVYHIRRKDELKTLLSEENKIHKNQEDPYRHQLIIGSLKNCNLLTKVGEKDIKDIKSFFCKTYLKKAEILKKNLDLIISNAILTYANEIGDTFSPARIRQLVTEALEISK